MSPLHRFIFFILLGFSRAQDGSEAPLFEPLFSSDGVTFTINERPTEGMEVGLVRAQGLPQKTVLYGLEEEWEGEFEIGNNSGEITVGPNGPDLLIIDGESLSVSFNVYAYYESTGPNGNRSNLMITVEVLDVNDRPYFENVETELFYIEPVEVGEVLQRFTATDNDLGVNAALEYSLEQIRSNNDSNEYFSIHRYTGDLSVRFSLDLGYRYIVTVTATDEGEPALSTSLNVSIRVDPVPPIFDKAVYETDLFEFTNEIGVAVVNVSATAQNGDHPVTYSMITWTPTPDGLNFTVESSSGLVEASGTLDRETFARYTIIVEAYEHEEATSETTIILHVKDINEPPQFRRSHYSTSVSEGASIGEVIHSTIEAIDGDEGTNAELSYTIGNISGLSTADGMREIVTEEAFFIINTTTAELYVNSDLEREAEVDGYHYYEITVIASDGGDPSLSASSLVTVTVIDINDNHPIFTSSHYTYNTSENVEIGAIIGTVQVSDRDEGVAANITFSLSGTGSDQFRIAVLDVYYPPTVQSRPPIVTVARIYTTGQLDRENISQYDLTVLAQDTTDQPLNGTAQITITILDINDNRPKFNKDVYTFSINEESLLVNTGGIIGSITATDADVGSNGMIEYSLAVGTRESELFILDVVNSTVNLRLLQSLDRETTDFYSLRLQANDGGSPSLVGETLINITILDVNDQIPVFSESQYEVDIAENVEVGTGVVNVTASDGDIGENAVLMYSVSGDSVVSVNSESGEVELVTMLDHEDSRRLEIEVTATDTGILSQSSTTLIIINVVDVNDNTPVFENSNYSVMVNEDITIGTEVIRITASDADSGIRGRISYGFYGFENETFAIDAESGAVTVVTSLDREQREQYKFNVTAEDMGMPLLSSMVELYITVFDVNDNDPIFQQSSYIALVSEGIQVNSSVGMNVIQVSATDADSGTNGQIFYILSGSEAERFNIDTNSGLITVVQPLDYETYTEPYVLTVIARDNGTSPRSTAVTLEITVTDSNDNAPTFLNLPYVVRLEEGTTGPLVVLVAMAIDLDEGENGEVQFLLIRGDGLFTADRLGNVSLLGGREIDREGEAVEVGEDGDGILILTLSAVDNGSPIQLSQTDLTILISDINDNAPVFQQTSYSTIVSEAIQLNTIIINVLATDADYGSNADIIYSIVEQQPNLTEAVFIIDNETGVISLSSSLDRENYDLFTLIVSARDQGDPISLSTSVSVTINISDANDNHPLFTIPDGGYDVSLSENSPLGSEVITVVATDRDSGLHSQITYFLSDVSVPFQIMNPEVGNITISSPLDRETNAEYNLIVVAMDTAPDSNSILQTETVVTVTILDVNDNAPVFSASSYEGQINENRPTGIIITLFPLLMATDADTPTNGIITYTLVGNDAEYFTLDPQTAQLTANIIFDAEVKHTYTDLQIIATDNGDLHSNVSLTVVIGDENDFSPFFTIEVNSSVIVCESLLSGTTVLIITASDHDVRGNRLNFTLGGFQQEMNAESSMINPFVIDSITGAITVGNDGLDFERSFYYVLTVLVQDNGVPPLSNSTDILVLLLDVNDNAPVFTPQSQSFHIQEHSDIGAVIGSVIVSDADSAELTQLEYMIIEGNEEGRFIINSTTGDIVTAMDIDREDGGSIYNLTIEVHDAPELFQGSIGTAIITVGDINDQTPLFISQSSTVEVREEMPPGALVIEYSAMDDDAGDNGSLFYSIIFSNPDDHFVINTITGEIFTAIQLDRETISSYQLIIEANDRGTPSLTGTSNLTIEVVDINDNSPEIIGSLEATIIENPLIGSLVNTNISAIDRDEGTNAELSWYIISGNVYDTFHVDVITGAILVENATYLDYETTPVFFLELLVEDDGEPSMSTTVLLRVSLLDANDHAPIISPLSPLTLPEDTSLNTIVAVVTATDEDEGTNAELEFLVVAGNTGGAFGMGPDGSLRVIAELDYETVTQYELIVEVHDGGFPEQVNSTTVVVTVTDINDNAPVFINLPAMVEISEKQATPQIATITIEDIDSGSNGLYNLDVVSANGGNPDPFYIIFTFLTAEGTLDYEEQSQYTLVLEASDRGVPSLTTQTEIIINIRDIDDNPPTFNELPRYIISESQSILTPFAILMTDDLDTAEENRNAFYYITGGAGAYYFDVISQTGQLFLDQLVDRELIAEYTVEITAQSFQGDASDCTSLTCSVTNLTVTLLDVNDNMPQWILKEYIIGVNETAQLNESIGSIKALDGDSGDFGLVWYRLTDPTTSLVTLEERTGVLRLNQSLNGLQSRVSPVFTAIAFDNRGVTPSMTSMNIPVMIVSVSAEYLVVLTIITPLDELLANPDQLYRAVEMVPGARLSVYEIREHTPSTNNNDRSLKRQTKEETEVVIFGLSLEDGDLLTSEETLTVLSDNASFIGDLYTVTTVKVFPTPSSDQESESIDRLTLTIVVAAIVVGVLLTVLVFTVCGCCCLQHRMKQKRKNYDPGRSDTHRRKEPRESVRYSTAEGVEFYGEAELGGWGEEEEHEGGRGPRTNHWVEDDMFSPKEVTMRSGKRRNRGGATDSGTRPRDSQSSAGSRRSVLYESKDYVMGVFEDSDGDESGEENDEEMTNTLATVTKHDREEGHETLELQERGDYMEEEGEEEDMAPMIRPQSQLPTVEEADIEVEEEEEEEGVGESGEWEDGTTGAEVWEEGEDGVWEEDELSPADMMTEEEARMLAAPLDDLPPNPLLF